MYGGPENEHDQSLGTPSGKKKKKSILYVTGAVCMSSNIIFEIWEFGKHMKGFKW